MTKMGVMRICSRYPQDIAVGDDSAAITGQTMPKRDAIILLRCDAPAQWIAGQRPVVPAERPRPALR